MRRDNRHALIGGRHRAASRYAMMVNRCRSETSKNACYAHVEVRIDRDTFVAWFRANDFPGARVDRIRKEEHYEVGNLQLLSLGDNIRKDKIIGDDTRATCSRCRQTKDADQFARDKRRKRGFTTTCRTCDNLRRVSTGS